MKQILLLFLSAFLLASCSTTNDSRYKNNATLERPPEIPIDKQATEQRAENEPEPPKRRYRKGLDSDVYKVEGSNNEMSIKRDYDESWSLVGQAILLRDLKIADQDRSKGNYYVVYDGGSLFGGYSPFSDDSKSTYLLRVESLNEETKVTVTYANKEDQSDSGSLKDGIADTSDDLSERLLELIYNTLHDDVKQD
ncbi:MAG: outer membrane protein assembly factor BamC [Methylococcaceae bacterium]|nr:outer membrane protein assembly factor BamC [Methylococcaceae bacterium]